MPSWTAHVTTSTSPPPLPPNPQWDGSLRPVALLVAGIVVVALLAYRFALPVAASAAAGYVPSAAVDKIGELTLAALEREFQESAVPSTRRETLVRRFAALRLPEGTVATDYEIVFRRSDTIGANAMALPSGTIVVTDGLVELTGTDDEIIAVLAHEAGHVQHRHGLRLVFQSSFASAGLRWLLGDVSAVAAQVSSTLLDAKYSRDFEREADEYAVRLLDENAIPRDHFVRMLERLEAASARRGMDQGGSLLAYLSSHPVTGERIAAIRQDAAP
jgi:Zn-dependent protease with chaperone function